MIIEFCDCCVFLHAKDEESGEIQLPSMQFLLVSRTWSFSLFLLLVSENRIFNNITFFRRKLDIGIYFGARSALGHRFSRPSFIVSLIKHRCRSGRGRARTRNEPRVSRILKRIHAVHPDKPIPPAFPRTRLSFVYTALTRWRLMVNGVISVSCERWI